MAARNLTRKFFELRNNAKTSAGVMRSQEVPTDDDGGLLERDANAANFKAMKERLPPLWVDKIEQAEDDISKINRKMKELSALHTKRLMVNFESDEQEQERQIEDATAHITQIFRHAEGILKKFDTAPAAASSSDKVSQAEAQVRNNLKRSLAKKLQTLSVSFRGLQKEYMTKLKALTKGASLEIFDGKGGAAAAAAATDAADSGFSKSQMSVVDDTERLVNERDEEITNIAKNIEEMAAIFRELSAMVIDQGTVLDRIDYNMEATVEQTKEGLQQLQKAEDHQKNSLSIKCIIFLCFLIFILVVIMIFKHKK